MPEPPGKFLTMMVGAPGQMLDHMTRQHAGVQVVAAAGGEPDKDRHRLAAIEIGDRFSLRARRRAQQPECPD
jgi:hypothetical protein